MASTLEQEIRDLRSRFWSDRDPEGRAFVSLADALRRSGEFDEAWALLQDGLARHPDFSSAHLVASWVHRDRGDLSAAEEACRRVLELDPENARALHGLGHLLARAGRLAAGRQLVVLSVELDPLLEWEEGSGAALTVVDVRELAPRSGDGILGFLPGVGPLVDIDFLAPDSVAEAPDEAAPVTLQGEVHDPWEELAPVAAGTTGDDEVVDIEALAPDPVDIGRLAPDAPEPALAAESATDSQVETADDPEHDEDEDEHEHAGDEDVHYTRTMVDLLSRQGLHGQALDVARRLLARSPHDEALRARVREMESQAGVSDAGEGGAMPIEKTEPTTPPRQEPVSEYLRDLLAWAPSEEPTDEGGS